MNKPFPPPPGHQKPASSETALTDEEQLFILQSHLRPEQMKDLRLLKFISLYLECRNASQAARESGGSTNWLRKPEIYAAIQAINAKAVMKYGYDAAELIERAKEIAFLDPLDFENPDGSYKRMSEMKPEARRAIKKFEVRNLYGQDANGMQIVIGQVMKIELWDKLKSFELLGAEKNIFKKTTVVEHDVTKNMASILLESDRRAESRKQLMSRDVTPGGDNGNEEIGQGQTGSGDES